MARCGQAATGKIVTLHSRDGHAHFGGVETCGSVWSCPVCAARITEGRREELEALLRAHGEAGGTAYMATLTLPHTRFQRCRDLLRAVTNAFRKVKSGRAWQTARDGYGWMGDVRALEVTHGAHGWHPHLHVLILFRPGTTAGDSGAFGSWLFDAWARAIARMGMGACSIDAFAFELVDAYAGAAGYVGKWGAALELTKAHMKAGRDGGRTPWQILADFAAHGSKDDRRLFREYFDAFKGARQLTWSRGLKRHYLGEYENTDEDLAKEEPIPESHVASLAWPIFQSVVNAHATADVLEALATGGLPALLQVLARLRIPWRLAWMPSLQRERWVPVIAPRLPGDRLYPWPETQETCLPGTPGEHSTH
ncbi:MAG: protein rep [Rhodospirillales bacterium]|nr:protein rep [Rhodospirillales bacterium]